eukprot:CAMPEP_0173063900 /NCGR_PEP_ID=MMETSP1102-20130122/4681_1 /TAXON_ID=49646 /ORGANISM="Geminigera sp., Strain Caron Lab Isolate" /LENGTH=63 /DNA_ID=CAMNT_0013930835 /DNA_START=572 /DNA_END=760 /DNA_ORIENTATION=-
MRLPGARRHNHQTPSWQLLDHVFVMLLLGMEEKGDLFPPAQSGALVDADDADDGHDSNGTCTT